MADGLHVYRLMVAAKIRSAWQYRTSFVMFLFAQATITSLEFVTILLLFDVVPDLGGWDRREVALLYGLATLPFAASDLIISPVERLSVHVRAGTFDRFLLRPASSLLQICAMEFELRRIGKLLPGVAVLWWAMAGVDVDWTPSSVGLLVLALTSGTVIYSALWIATASLSFWIVATQEATNAVTYGGQFANEYPLHLYPGWIRAVLGWIVPLAFVAYVPAVALLDVPNPLALPDDLVYASIPVAAATLVVSLRLWSLGIRHYQSTGS